MKKKNKNPRKEKGFVLISLVLVMGIIAILYMIQIPRTTGYVDVAKDEAAIPADFGTMYLTVTSAYTDFQLSGGVLEGNGTYVLGDESNEISKSITENLLLPGDMKVLVNPNESDTTQYGVVITSDESGSLKDIVIRSGGQSSVNGDSPK
ncbi:MAG: type IV pilin protein [Lachnospirales bacterium]